MTRAIAMLAAVVLALGSAACGSADQDPAQSEPAQTGAGAADVPAGVAQQYSTIEQEIDTEGGETSSGPWRIGYIVEPAEGWFERRGEGYAWRAPAPGETHHIEIVPIEAASGRLVPDVPVTLEVLDPVGRRVARKRLRLYYAEFFHYAANFALPRAGRYTLRATLGAPSFPRHGEQADAPPLAEGATVEFPDVLLEPERGG